MAKIDPILEKKVDELKARLRTVAVDGKTFYVAEGDLLLEESKLPDYLPHAANVTPPGVPGGSAGRGLLGIVENGKIVRWSPDFVITYRVLQSSFNSDHEHAIVRSNMGAATRDWESTCGVAFREVVGDGEALFDVRRYDAGGSFIAAAFFPNSPPEQRYLLIDPSYFSRGLGYDPVGVLRHELGHVLGFRHEHIRSGAPPVCPKESLEETVDLTRFDPRSVMHYFCGGVGTRNMEISALDREGSQAVYGPPRAGARVAA